MGAVLEVTIPAWSFAGQLLEIQQLMFSSQLLLLQIHPISRLHSAGMLLAQSFCSPQAVSSNIKCNRIQDPWLCHVDAYRTVGQVTEVSRAERDKSGDTERNGSSHDVTLLPSLAVRSEEDEI